MTRPSIHSLLTQEYPVILTPSNSVEHAKIVQLSRLIPEILEEEELDIDAREGADDDRILNLFRERFPTEESLIIHYLGLEEWDPGSGREEAINEIVEAYKANAADLFLENYRLTSFPPGLHLLLNLKQIYLSNNVINSFPEDVSSLVQVKMINLSDNALSYLPDEFQQLTELESLYLDTNPLENVPDAIQGLTGLRELGLSGTQIEEVPEFLGNLRGLLKLNLSGNELTELPRSIGNLVNLKELDVSNNQLTGLPAEMTSLTRIEFFNCSSNEIVDFSGMPPGRYFANFDGNPFWSAYLESCGIIERSVQEYLEHFLLAAKGDKSEATNYIQLDTPGYSNFRLWLQRLLVANDFKNPHVKVGFSIRVLTVLKFAVENSEFKKNEFDAVISDQSCNDNATLCLDNLEMAMKIYQAGGFTPEVAKNVMIDAYIVDVLTKIARAKIPELKARVEEIKAQTGDNTHELDEVEVYLAYRVGVGRLMDKVLGSQTMMYDRESYLNSNDLELAKQEVEKSLEDTEALIEFFLSQSSWKKVIDTQFAAEKEAIMKPFVSQRESTDLHDKAAFEQIDINEKIAVAEWFSAKTKEFLTKKRSLPDLGGSSSKKVK